MRICDTRTVGVTTPSNQCSNKPVVAGAANTLKVNVANWRVFRRTPQQS